MTITNSLANNWGELVAEVEGNSGILMVTVATLRALEGRQRVGKHVLSAIMERLSERGLGHLPEQIPNRQQQRVLLYRQGTPASEVIRAVRNALTDSPTEAAYDYLHRLNTLPDPTTVIPKEDVREVLAGTYHVIREMLSDTEEDTVTRPRTRHPRRQMPVQGIEVDDYPESASGTDMVRSVLAQAAGVVDAVESKTPKKPELPPAR